ncbi:hypothetical protein RIF29_14878 [Crotalaria pallida]|uniref:Uncharacterized protein n=1 Tax=Crotalaria pallida TaxID=3830 RepID=A0AAN9FE18_CROPI
MAEGVEKGDKEEPVVMVESSAKEQTSQNEGTVVPNSVASLEGNKSPEAVNSEVQVVSNLQNKATGSGNDRQVEIDDEQALEQEAKLRMMEFRI